MLQIKLCIFIAKAVYLDASSMTNDGLLFKFLHVYREIEFYLLFITSYYFDNIIMLIFVSNNIIMHSTLARRVFIVILLFDIALFHCILACFPYLLEKRTRRISRYSYLLETLISSEYGLTISDHVTVLSQWLLEKNTDYIINKKSIFII